jgi:hypothetical protein
MDAPSQDSGRSRLRRLVDAEVERLDTGYSAEFAPVQQVTAYHRAAAVLAVFDTTLQPAGRPGEDESIADVFADSESVVHGGGLSFRLQPDVRRRVLRTLRTRTAMLDARRANAAIAADGLQGMVDRYIDNTAPELSQQNLAELTASFEIAPWLHGILTNVPSPIDVRARIDLETLLSSFEDLVGKHFGGRETDLAKLHDYVGVLPPSTVIEGLWRNVRAVTSLHEKPPLVLFAPGGYGKSTLVARFILEYARLDDARRFPFVYLDFDRATITADDPLTLLLEAVRQLGIQYVDTQRQSEGLRESWRLRMTRAPARSANQRPATKRGQPPLSREDRASFIQDFKSYLRAIDMGDRPLLLVLDTFEEVQRRSTTQVGDLWSFLGLLQREVPRLRVVVSGRAPVTGVEIDKRPLQMQLQELGRLDVDASTAILQKQGLPANQARRIASRVGGSPLTLRLAAQLLRKLKDTSAREADAEFDDDKLAAAVAEGEIDRYLYTRILEHIQVDAVKRLAHPGFVLRRITPDLILRVLNEPCDLRLQSLADAVTLFRELEKEVSLVTPTSEADTLRHRPDLRQLMLRFMERTDLHGVQDIHRRAVRYYGEPGKGDPVERAEEIYHRLALGESGDILESRWLTGVVERYLYNALEDLPPAPRSWLATHLHVELTDEERHEAPLEVWELDAMRRARELIVRGQFAAASSIVRERSERSSASPLYQVEADLLVAQGHHQEAVAVLDEGIKRSFATGSDAMRVDLQLAAAAIEVTSGVAPAAHRRLDDIQALALQRDDTLQLIELTLTRIDALRMEGASQESEEVIALVEQVREWCARTSDEQFNTRPELARRVGSEVGGKDTKVLARVVRLAGIGTPNSSQLRALGEALADWNRQLVKEQPNEPEASLGITALSRLVSFEAAGDLNWQSFVLTAPLSSVEGACRRILQELTPPPHIAKVFAHLLGRASAPVARDASPPGSPPRAEHSTLQLDPEQRLKVVEAMLDAYPTLGRLDQLVSYSLNRSLSAITTETVPRYLIHDLFAAAEADGWADRLLRAAYEGQRDNIPLRQIVEELGLIFSIGMLLPRIVGAGDDWSVVAKRLIEHEGRVCRVEMRDGFRVTGSLVAPDIVMTPASATLSRIGAQQSFGDAWVRFDDFGGAEEDGERGSRYELASTDWLVDASPDPAALDVAFIRLSEPAGFEPIGAKRALPSTPPRGWLRLRPESVEKDTPILLVHYPADDRLSMTLQENGVQRIANDGRELFYRASTPLGAAGAPIFNRRMDLIGIHMGNAAGWLNIGVKRAISTQALFEWVRTRPRLGRLSEAT